MKTIILSDIQGNAESIIPYGLRFGKHTGTEVEIAHSVDPRREQGASSPYANSQSITPGDMLSHDNIIQREKNKAEMSLQKLISSEGSRLNYPLKIKTEIREGSAGSMMKEMTRNYPGSIVIASNEPSNSMIENLDEMVEITGALDLPTLFIPPEYPFSEPKKALLATDFKHTNYENLKEMIQWLVPFNLNIHAFGLAGSTEHLDMEMESAAWKKIIKTYLDPHMTIKTSVIDYGEKLEVLVDYLKRNGADLLLVPRYMLKSTAGSPLSKRSFKKLLGEIDLPVAIF